GSRERFAYLPGEIRQCFDIIYREFLLMIVDDEEPVAAPGDISADRPVSANIDHYPRCCSIAWNIGYGYLSIIVKDGFDDADWSFDLVPAGADALQVREGNHETAGAMATHAQIPYVVKEDH